jgi:hypothetical protein
VAARPSSPPAQVACLLVAVAAAQALAPSARLAFYAAALAVPAVVAIAFNAYVALLERGVRPWSADIAALSLAGALLMIDAAGRFGDQLATPAPARPGALVLLAALAAASPLAWRALASLRTAPVAAARSLASR